MASSLRELNLDPFGQQPQRIPIYRDEPEFVDRVRNNQNYPVINNPDGSVSTHRMAAESDANGNWYVFPTIQMQDGELVEYYDSREAMDAAFKTGNILRAPNKQSALNYAEGAYKRGTGLGNKPTTALMDIEELAGYTQENPMPVGADIMTQQEAISELGNREMAASAAGTVSPFESSWNPTNPNFRATAQNAISNMLGGSNISSNPNYLQGRIANTLSGLVDFAPVVGDAVGVGDTITSYRQGDMLGTGINAAATGIGVLPLVGGPASKAVKAGGNRVRSALRGIDAWHGSPYEFENFSMDKMGTGEGVQAYGNGLYFAEQRGIGEGYRDNLSRGKLIDGNLASSNLANEIPYDRSGNIDANRLNRVIEDREYALSGRDSYESELRDWERYKTDFGSESDPMPEYLASKDSWDAEIANEARKLELLKKVQSDPSSVSDVKGSLYNVNLNVEPDELLDWDAPLSEQSENVKDLGRKLFPEVSSNEMHFIDNQREAIHWTELVDGELTPEKMDIVTRIMGRNGKSGEWKPYGEHSMESITGAEIYHKLANSEDLPEEFMKDARWVQNLGQAERTQGFNDVGTSLFMSSMGIKGIRYLDGTSRSAGEGTRNFVIFDDSLIDTKRVNDKLTPSWMDQGARMARADDGGFLPETVYTGTAADIVEFNPKKFGGSVTRAKSAKMGTWFSDNPEVSAGYAKMAAEDMPVQKLVDASNSAERAGQWDKAHDLMAQAEKLEQSGELIGGGGQNIIPSRIRGNLFEVDVDGATMSDLDDSQLATWATKAKKEGFDGLKIKNFSDNADYGTYTPATHYLIFDPKNIRSINAEFDPTKADSADLLSSISPTQSSLRNIA